MRMQRLPTGSQPSTFHRALASPHLIGRRSPSGAVGQFVCSDHPLRYAQTLRTALEDMGLVDSSCKFGWEDGNGNAPWWWQGAANSADVMTTVGAPAPGQPTGLVDANGQAITAEVHAGASYRKSAVPINPSSDVVVAIVGHMPCCATGGFRAFSTRSAAVPQGIDFYEGATGIGAALYNSGGAAVPAVLPVGRGNIFLAIAILDVAGARLTAWSPGGISTAVIPAGTITDAGIGLCGLVDGLIPWVGGILGAYYAVGADISAQWLADTYALPKLLARRIFGTNQRAGGAATIVRATAASRVGFGGVHILASAGMPRVADDGILLEPVRINKVYGTIGVALGALAYWIGDDASTATGLADVAALAAAKADRWGPNVCSYANASGASRYLRCGAATGAVTRFTLSVYARIVAGAGAEIGWWDTAGPGWSAVGAITDSYTTRTVYDHLVPPAATCIPCVHVPNGCTLYWWAAQSEGSGSANECIVTSPMPNSAVATAAQRNAESLTLAEDPSDTEGQIDLRITPVGWSAAEAGTVAIEFISGSGNASLWVEGGTWRCRIDGTTDLNSGVAPADGVEHYIRRTWKKDSVQAIEVWSAGVRLAHVESSYDGTIYSAGTWQLVPSASIRVRDYETFQKGGG